MFKIEDSPELEQDLSLQTGEGRDIVRVLRDIIHPIRALFPLQGHAPNTVLRGWGYLGLFIFVFSELMGLLK